MSFIMNSYLNSTPHEGKIPNMNYRNNNSMTSSEKEMERIAINIASLIANQLKV